MSTSHNNAGARTLALSPILICILDQGSVAYTFATWVWNVASDCRLTGTVNLTKLLAHIEIDTLWQVLEKGKCRL